MGTKIRPIKLSVKIISFHDKNHVADSDEIIILPLMVFRFKNYIFIIAVILLFTECSKQEKRKPLKRKTRSAISIMRTNDCFVCHGIVDYDGVPSYKMVADRYGNDYNTIRTLSEKVLEGGGGNWGSGLMVKHPFLKESEAKDIVKWVLSLDSDSVVNRYNQNVSELSTNSRGPISIVVYNDTDTLINGSIDHIFLAGPKYMKEGRHIKLLGSIPVKRRGKHFFNLIKSGTGKMLRGKNTIISEREEDSEIMLELSKGNIPFTIEYSVESEEDTLALFWLPVGKSYYGIFKGSSK